MRHPVKLLPEMINPWKFTRQRELLSGTLQLAQTQVLKQWAGEDSVLNAHLEGNIDADSQHRLSGSVSVTLQMQCQRCLEMMPVVLDESFDYVLIAHEDLEHKVTDGSETLICASDELDLAWFFEEEILLAIPMIVKHEDCNVLQKDTDSPATNDEDRQYPFADLKKLLDLKEHP